MTHSSTRPGLLAAIAAAAVLTLAGCGDDTDSINSDDAESITDEARDRADQAEEDLGDLQDEVDEKLDEAGEAVDEGIARGQAEVFKQRLTELGDDDTPTRAVTELESLASELPGDPEVTGIEDSDGDGDDDDGKVQITVDDSAMKGSSCTSMSR